MDVHSSYTMVWGTDLQPHGEVNFLNQRNTFLFLINKFLKFSLNLEWSGLYIKINKSKKNSINLQKAKKKIKKLPNS